MNCPGCPAGEVVLVSARQALQAFDLRAVRLTILPQVWVPPWE
jgi:metal-sulfur cluster biosynthetic enzyme